MDIYYSQLPTEIPFPVWVVSSGVFDGVEGEPHKYGRAYRWKHGEVDCALIVSGGSILGPKHLEAWKALYLHQRLCEARHCVTGCSFEILEADLMELLGVEAGDHIGKEEIHRVLRDLVHVNFECTSPPTKPGRERGGWKSESIFSMYGHRDSVRKPWWYSFHVGPKFSPDDWPAMPFDMVQVTNEDIENLKYWEAVPLTSYGDAVEEEAEPEEIRSTRKAKSPPRTPGYVYILTNPAMPGLIKIGKTRLNPTDRANQLQTTGVPQGFQVEYACHTPDPEAVEQAMHVAFGPRRVNDRREFFEIEPEQAVAVLALHHQAEPSTTVQ